MLKFHFLLFILLLLLFPDELLVEAFFGRRHFHFEQLGPILFVFKEEPRLPRFHDHEILKPHLCFGLTDNPKLHSQRSQLLLFLFKGLQLLGHEFLL